VTISNLTDILNAKWFQTSKMTAVDLGIHFGKTHFYYVYDMHVNLERKLAYKHSVFHHELAAFVMAICDSKWRPEARCS
jgi:hypothetical protein